MLRGEAMIQPVQKQVNVSPSPIVLVSFSTRRTVVGEFLPLFSF